MLVSVIMPAYNAQDYIGYAIESVQKQTVDDWELIIIDDCSSDDTCDIVEEYCKNDNRITLYKNEKNMGVAYSRNRGFDLSKGQYVALLDSDDYWHSDKLERQIDLSEKTGAEVIYCSYEMVNENGEKKCEAFIVPEETNYDKMLCESVISCSTALLKKETIEEHRFLMDYYHEDYVFWLELLRSGYKATGNTEILAAYRLLDGSRASDKRNAAINRWKIYRNSEKLPLFKSIKVFCAYAFLGLKKYAAVKTN